MRTCHWIGRIGSARTLPKPSKALIRLQLLRAVGLHSARLSNRMKVLFAFFNILNLMKKFGQKKKVKSFWAFSEYVQTAESIVRSMKKLFPLEQGNDPVFRNEQRNNSTTPTSTAATACGAPDVQKSKTKYARRLAKQKKRDIRIIRRYPQLDLKRCTVVLTKMDPGHPACTAAKASEKRGTSHAPPIARTHTNVCQYFQITLKQLLVLNAGANENVVPCWMREATAAKPATSRVCRSSGADDSPLRNLNKKYQITNQCLIE